MELAQSNSGTLCVEQFLVDPLMVATGCSWRRILQRSGKPVMVPTNAGGTGYPTLDVADDMAQLMAASPQLMVAVKLQVDAFKLIPSPSLAGNPRETRQCAGRVDGLEFRSSIAAGKAVR